MKVIKQSKIFKLILNKNVGKQMRIFFKMEKKFLKNISFFLIIFSKKNDSMKFLIRIKYVLENRKFIKTFFKNIDLLFL